MIHGQFMPGEFGAAVATDPGTDLLPPPLALFEFPSFGALPSNMSFALVGIIDHAGHHIRIEPFPIAITLRCVKVFVRTGP